MPLHYVVTYRLDFLALGLFSVAALWLSTRYVRARRSTVMRIPAPMHFAVWLLMTAAGVIAEFAAESQRQYMVSVFSGYGPTFAHELAEAGHAQVQFSTAADDPAYLRLIERQKTWLQLNPFISDIYTVRRDDQGHIRFLVDSETDYDRNGRYEGPRETRTPIGEVFFDATPAFFDAAAGRPAFDSDLAPNRWGVFVTSLTPIRDAEGRVDAVVGVDYPADHWLSAIASRRALVLTLLGMLILLLITSAALMTLMRSEIFERRATERKLQLAKDAADEANRAKGSFLAIMSHEIRTPLTAITGYASMLEDTPLDTTQQRYVRTLRRGATSLVDLLNNVLDFSRIEEGKLQLEHIPCSPASIAHDVLDLLSAAANDKGLRLVNNDQLPAGLTVSADPARLRQILMNLIGNAVKFTAAGSVTVTARWISEAEGEATGRLVFIVADTGPGIPAEKLANLFQMFAQADTAVARKHGGSGLGLAISRQLAELMRGRIEVESTVGRGSEFVVTLPCERIPAAPVAPARPIPVAPALAGVESPSAASEAGPAPALPDRPPADTLVPQALPGNRRLLVVDDNPHNREVLKSFMVKSGYQVDLANSGALAVQMVAERTYAAVLMDLAMPGMDGYEATAQIRALAHGPNVPIIAVTASALEAVRQKCFAAGMDDFVAKPVERERVLEALDRQFLKYASKT